MKRRILILSAVVVLLAITVVPALAITNGQPDGGAHPYVGLVVLIDGDGVPLWRCSGSLISPSRFLLAGHCTAPDGPDVPATAAIWFGAGPILTDPDFPGNSLSDPNYGTCDALNVDGYPCVGDASGIPHTNPGFCIGCGKGLPGFAIRDVGVVTLDSPHAGPYAELPTAGLVDTLKNKTAIDFVGYGVQFQISGQGGVPPQARWTGPRQRMYAPSELVSGKFVHSDEFMRFALNASQGSGGTCFGDSGGPDLLAGTDTVLAVNSYVTNYNCSGVGYSQRVDTPDVLAWINSFLP